ncbi:hypothetical protein Hanom_Chr06g00482401 [Helianthus anomalus]
MDPVIRSWRFDEDTDMATVVCDNSEQEDYMFENIMTRQSLGFIEELYNATCLNTDMT